MEKGLIPKAYDDTRIKYEPSIFASNSKKNLAFDYVGYGGQENLDVWEIETDQPIFKDPFSSYTGHFFMKEAIPPGKVKLIKCY